MKDMPNTEFSNWMEGFEILRSVTKNLGKRDEGNSKSYPQWNSWNTNSGYMCKDIQPLLDAVMSAYKEETGQTKLILLMPAYKKWMASKGENDHVVFTEHRHINDAGREIRQVDVFATLQNIINHMNERNPVKSEPKQSKLPLNMNQEYALKCQLEALERRIKILENNAHSSFNMEQFQRR